MIVVQEWMVVNVRPVIIFNQIILGLDSTAPGAIDSKYSLCIVMACLICLNNHSSCHSRMKINPGLKLKGPYSPFYV